jgi:hypothetical protein
MTQSVNNMINCACVIHGDAYSWTYVDRLYSMLNRNITAGIRLHVYTEADRPVPDHMIKHELTNWGIGGPKKSWWYKMQLFNAKYHAGPMLYFDLDVVIVNKIDWILDLPLTHFWALRDFKYLWRPTHYGINSSVMWWDTTKFDYVWQNFTKKNLDYVMRTNRGDQDYISKSIDLVNQQFLDSARIKSWRWQVLDGGYDFKRQAYNTPGSGTQLDNTTSVLVFHGQPKPAQTTDFQIVQHWQ